MEQIKVNKTMLQFVKYSQSSLASCAIDLLSFYALLNLLGGYALSGRWNVIFLSTVIARLLSSAFNFFFNRNLVFRHQGKDIKTAAFKYYVLCCVSIALSGCFVSLCAYAFTADTAPLVTFIKIIVDSGLFIMNYYVQRKWVFK